MTESGRHRERPLDSGILEGLRECVARVVRGVGPLWELVCAADDDWGVGGYEEIGAKVRFTSADDDGIEIACECPVD